jgi:hypothetical protein
MGTLRDESPHTLRRKASEFRRLAAASVIELQQLAEDCERRASELEDRRGQAPRRPPARKDRAFS